MAEDKAPKLSLAFLNTKLVAQDLRIASMQDEIDELKSRLTALGNTRGSPQNRNIGRPITANQAKALGELGDDTTGWDFMRASKRLDEWSAALKAAGIRHYGCGTNEHKHTDRDEARRCAMSPKVAPAPAPEASDLELPAYS